MSRITILGAGAWGTSLAISLHRHGGHDLTLWAHAAEEAAEIKIYRKNRIFLPDFTVPQEINVTSHLDQAVTNADVILCVVPSEFLRATFVNAAPFITAKQIAVSATKGIEPGTFLRMSEVMAELTPAKVAALSGPSFAEEVAKGLPTAVTVASTDMAVAKRLQEDFSSSSLRVYANDDLIGVELGGALKNVIALASGIVAGLDLGHNVSAALITRGVVEITRLAVACGGRPETLAGLSGLGDLVLTCTGSLSRNRTVGMALGRGQTLSQAVAALHGKVAEGVVCTSAALGLAKKYKVEMPITEQMDAILHHGKSPTEAIHELMTRSLRAE